MPYGFANSMHKAYVTQQATQSHRTYTVAEISKPPKELTTTDYLLGGVLILVVVLILIRIIVEDR